MWWWLLGCAPVAEPEVTEVVSYVDITAEAGLFGVHWDALEHPTQCSTGEVLAGAAAAGDFDGDGWTDLWIARMHAPDQLYRNLGNGRFEEIGAQAGVDHAGTSSGGLWFDADGDGDLDLFTTSMAAEPQRLYIQSDPGVFVDEAADRGLVQQLPEDGCAYQWGASAADIDGDGDLDLHTLQWHTAPGLADTGSRLYLNHQGQFTDVTDAWNLDLEGRAAFSSAFADFDDDGDPDLAVAADWGTSGLWWNEGDRFVEGVDIGVGLDENGMGSDVADVDGDGDLDWLVTAIYDATPCDDEWGCSGNRLYLNDGAGRFEDGTDAAGLRDGQWGWGAAWFDHDNDGDLDLGHATGYPIGGWDWDTNVLFDNEGGVFTDRAAELGLDQVGQGRAWIPFDMDNDGDLDVLTTRGDAGPTLYENRGASDRSWIRITASETGNAQGIGARIDVWLTEQGPAVRRDLHANTNFAGTRPPEAHVGLGERDTLHQVVVTWPDGEQTTVSAPTTRQRLHIAR